MAGFFQRVAEDSLAPTTRLRPAAALPYARRANALVEESAVAADVPDVEQPHASLTPRPVVRTPPAPNPVVNSTSIERHREMPRDAAVPDERESSRSVAVAQSDPGELELQELTTRRHTQRTTARTESVATASRESAVRASSGAQIDTRVTPAAAARAGQTAAATGSARSTRPPRDASPPPDVHIHIGRIELTAVTPCEQPRREHARGKKPMSLDEYLQRRSGNSR
jgi:hypothetical protein